MLDVLIPTCNRPAALAVTLTSLNAQTVGRFRVIVSDQSDVPVSESGEVRAAIRVLEAHGCMVEVLRHLPRRGMAEQRQFLLDQARAPYALFLDDDLILEPWVLGQMLEAIRAEGCGFVGSAVIGLSYRNDVRPHQQAVTFWEGPVQPETVRPGTPQWERYTLHNAANLYHVQRRLRLSPDATRPYKVAWVGGCVLYDTARLRQVGGFSFWRELPAEHAGEDVLAQLRVMARFGGCGLMPSGVYHQELPTTVRNREVDAPRVLEVEV
ncbi:GT2 family glycosyltransferase [Deinobacterium chartae]|uniref:GT2 family glycosyltransferase n=1 Tax=Deinobacterium chartae TaxID=521158 RepID=A0A841HZT6_9DEIO|nr:glycosyltransferase family 2 protein [Deinobacterium chartae]MBB6097392.1 GT2 family glycosyltransferase [Deinobacterium chartae]